MRGLANQSSVPSYVGWIDLTPGDVAAAKRFLDSFFIEDTIDALGFQPISDFFADRFYPGITTPMTRARYFIFVPAIYHLAMRANSTRNIASVVEELQIDLRRKLLKSEGRKQGVIGEKREDLTRYPSAVYWNGLRKLGILQSDVSEPSLQAQMSASMESDDLVTDEGPLQESNGDRKEVWAEVPLDGVLSGKQIRRSVDLTLTAQERRDLSARYLECRDTAASVMAARLKEKDATLRPHVWDAPRRGFRTEFGQSRTFSAAAAGASYVYEHLVEERIRRRARRRQQGQKPVNGFDLWWRDGRDIVRGWNITEFTSLLAKRPELVLHEDREFFLAVKDAAKERTPDRFVSSLAQEIVDREYRKRPRKCRLHEHSDPKLLEQWRPTKHRDPVFSLPYRHRSGQTILRDILGKPLQRSLDV